MELKLRLMELNWQKSQCVKVIAADERTKSEVRVRNEPFLSSFFAGDIYIFVGQACSICLIQEFFKISTFSNFTVSPYFIS